MLCFKDNNFNISTIPAVFTTSCPVHGQYVIYYNERLPNVTYPKEYSAHAQNNLCEVEVYGKCFVLLFLQFFFANIHVIENYQVSKTKFGFFLCLYISYIFSLKSLIVHCGSQRRQNEIIKILGYIRFAYLVVFPGFNH